MAQSASVNQGNSEAKEGLDAELSEPKVVQPQGPVDVFNRGVPRSSLKGYLKAARGGDFERAVNYLDLRYLPDRIDVSQGPQLARKLKVALDKVLWFDLAMVSDHPAGFSEDGLPADRDNIGQIKTPEKIEKAVDIILKILDKHEGMEPGLPPRAYFSEYNPYSLNIMVLYWYHPADYWGYMKFSQWVNLQIAREFQKEGSKFAFPTSTTYLSQDDNQPLNVNLGGSLP